MVGFSHCSTRTGIKALLLAYRHLPPIITTRPLWTPAISRLVRQATNRRDHYLRIRTLKPSSYRSSGKRWVNLSIRLSTPWLSHPTIRLARLCLTLPQPPAPRVHTLDPLPPKKFPSPSNHRILSSVLPQRRSSFHRLLLLRISLSINMVIPPLSCPHIYPRPAPFPDPQLPRVPCTLRRVSPLTLRWFHQVLR